MLAKFWLMRLRKQEQNGWWFSAVKFIHRRLEKGLKQFIKRTYWLIIVAVLIVALDQITKWLVIKYIPHGGVWNPWEWLAPYARIVHWSNTGAAFGLLQGMNPVFIGLALVVTLGIIYYYQSVEEKDWLIKMALMFVLGGAVGNLIDRFNHGHVIDLISVGNFPVFNVADSFITVGVVLLIIGVWVQEKREKGLQKAAELQEEETRGVS